MNNAVQEQSRSPPPHLATLFPGLLPHLGAGLSLPPRPHLREKPWERGCLPLKNNIIIMMMIIIIIVIVIVIVIVVVIVFVVVVVVIVIIVIIIIF